MTFPRLALSLLMAATTVAAQDKPVPAGKPVYDEALAKRLGADERGMRSYVFVILKAGPKTDFTKEESSKLFAGHMANIQRLAAEGKLALAGPFQENQNHYEGLFIFNVKTVKEAEALIVTDPAVAAGRFAYDAYGWYGSAAVMEIVSIHNRIQKTAP